MEEEFFDDSELLSPELSLLGETFDVRCEGRFLKSRYESFVKLRQKQQPHSVILAYFALNPFSWNIPEGSGLVPRVSNRKKNANKRQYTADDRWRALQRGTRALPEIGVERNKNSKKD